MNEVTLCAPLSGWAAPLSEVPDPVFAEGMMGEGFAIDPTDGVLRAPCAATIISVPETRHAITLRLENGAELLIHIGLEAVALGGAGFTAHVIAGDKVSAGDLLITFDMDSVARRAKSLITPIVVTGDGYALSAPAVDRAVSAGDRIAAVGGKGQQGSPTISSSETHSVEAVVGHRHGIHARPAARIAAALRAFTADVVFEGGGKFANGRSTVALMSLGLHQGDRIRIVATGLDARAATAALLPLVEQDRDEDAPVRPQTPAASQDGALTGICAAPGLAIGSIARLKLQEVAVARDGEGVEWERAGLSRALTEAAERLLGNSIAEAHRALLDDPELLAAAEAQIAEGRSAAFAWSAAVDTAIHALQATGDTLLIERIDDLRDIRQQVVTLLTRQGTPAPQAIPQGAILIAETILPSQLMAMDAARLAGICTAAGGPTSHAAILAASAGIPMLVAAGERVLHLPEGATAILDASGGTLQPEPNPQSLAAAQDRLHRQQTARATDAAAAHDDCVMADGTRIEIFANLASAEEARRAVEAGAEGCGLLRTEFLFHDRETAPSEEEQYLVYTEIAEALGGRPLIIRTLDAGADKPIPYLPMAREDNPALGVRGVRLSLARPDLLRTQLRAIVRAAESADIKIMVPMIVELAELKAVRALLGEAAGEIGSTLPPLGVMIETPAAALLAGSIAAEADFLSVGTNDLSQYALASDRGNPATAARIDPLHPAVLKLIAAAADGARAHGKWLGICGGAASDPLASAILIGLGATELSATPSAMPAIKAQVRRLDMEGCRALAHQALAAAGAAEVRTLAAAHISRGSA